LKLHSNSTRLKGFSPKVQRKAFELSTKAMEARMTRNAWEAGEAWEPWEDWEPWKPWEPW
jgi:hypothetical protein